MSTAEIRPIVAADFDAWLPLWKGYQDFYRVSIDDAVTRNTWARFLDPAEPVHAALAYESGRAIGMVHWIYHRSTWTAGDYCYLQDLYVDQDARGTGAGRKLIEHVYAEAAAANWSITRIAHTVKSVMSSPRRTRRKRGPLASSDVAVAMAASLVQRFMRSSTRPRWRATSSGEGDLRRGKTK